MELLNSRIEYHWGEWGEGNAVYWGRFKQFNLNLRIKFNTFGVVIEFFMYRPQVTPAVIIVIQLCGILPWKHITFEELLYLHIIQKKTKNPDRLIATAITLKITEWATYIKQTEKYKTPIGVKQQ